MFESSRDVFSNGVKDKKKWRCKQSTWGLLPATWNFSRKKISRNFLPNLDYLSIWAHCGRERVVYTKHKTVIRDLYGNYANNSLSCKCVDLNNIFIFAPTGSNRGKVLFSPNLLYRLDDDIFSKQTLAQAGSEREYSEQTWWRVWMGGPHVGCRLKFHYFAGCRLKFSTFVGCR